MAKEYRMPVDRNIFYAKSNLVELIWREAVIEGIDCSYNQVKTLCKGKVGWRPDFLVKDAVAIANLKRAWDFVLDTIDVPVDLSYVRQLNGIICAGLISEAGELRRIDVSMGGTAWKPEMPNYDIAKTKIAKITEHVCDVDGALEMFCYLTRAQLFVDGNKRTAQLVANKLLIANGCGIFMIHGNDKEKFGELLTGFYESGNREELCGFLAKTSMEVFRAESEGADPAYLVNKYGENYAKAYYSFPPCSIRLLEDYPEYKRAYRKGIYRAVKRVKKGKLLEFGVVELADNYARGYVSGLYEVYRFYRNLNEAMRAEGLSVEDRTEEILRCLEDRSRREAIEKKYKVRFDSSALGLGPVSSDVYMSVLATEDEDGNDIYLRGMKEDLAKGTLQD